mgnify:CR=1 FL=1
MCIRDRVLCLYLNAPEYVLERMATMPVGSSFEFDGIKITRWSNLTYNGKAIWVGELRFQNPFLGLICQIRGKIIPIGWSFHYFKNFSNFVLHFIKNMIYFNKLIDICINRQESHKVVDNYFVGTKKSRYCTILYSTYIVLYNRKNRFLKK